MTLRGGLGKIETKSTIKLDQIKVVYGHRVLSGAEI